jgi:hypothetical protein
MIRLRYYMLDAEHHVVETNNVITWAQWFEDANRVVDWTQITSEITVSTVFLGLDHRFAGAGPPLLFETMIFGGPAELDETCWRYSSWDDAQAGHAAAVRKARAAIGQRVS